MLNTSITNFIKQIIVDLKDEVDTNTIVLGNPNNLLI